MLIKNFNVSFFSLTVPSPILVLRLIESFKISLDLSRGDRELLSMHDDL